MSVQTWLDLFATVVTLPLATVFTVVHIRWLWKIRDALYANMLPFMWCIAVLVALTEVAIWGPGNALEGDFLGASSSVLFALIWSVWARSWYRRWKDSDDDTWKRRRRRVSERIELVAGRLVPVPVTS